MNILVKIPTRSRPDNFFNLLDGYIKHSTGKNIQYLITIDKDDDTMNTPEISNKFSKYNNIIVSTGVSKTKVQAYNRDVDKATGWDIIVVASDDMICVQDGWDEIIKNEMIEFFPDTDGVLHHNDFYSKKTLNTLPILGKKYYDRFDFIYNPEYTSLWCDNEFMEVAEKLGKQKYFEHVLFKHEHYTWNNKVKADALMKRNESYYHIDKLIFDKRKLINFGL